MLLNLNSHKAMHTGSSLHCYFQFDYSIDSSGVGSGFILGGGGGGGGGSSECTVFTRLQARATNSFPKILTLPLFEAGVNLRQAFIN